MSDICMSLQQSCSESRKKNYSMLLEKTSANCITSKVFFIIIIVRMNRPVHFEIHAEDLERASKFYSELFGRKFTRRE